MKKVNLRTTMTEKRKLPLVKLYSPMINDYCYLDEKNRKAFITRPCTICQKSHVITLEDCGDPFETGVRLREEFEHYFFCSKNCKETFHDPVKLDTTIDRIWAKLMDEIDDSLFNFILAVSQIAKDDEGKSGNFTNSKILHLFNLEIQKRKLFRAENAKELSL